MQISITTECNRSCPNCVLKTSDVSQVDIELVAKHFQGIKFISITGGEPTTHPEFNNVVIELRMRLQPRVFELQTNGFKVLDYIDVINQVFDRIILTKYSEETYPGCPSNETLVLAILQSPLKPKIKIHQDIHVPMISNGKQNPCFRYKQGPLYFNDRMYPCCASATIHSGIELEDDWQNQKPPCEKCPWAT